MQVLIMAQRLRVKLDLLYLELVELADFPIGSSEMDEVADKIALYESWAVRQTY